MGKEEVLDLDVLEQDENLGWTAERTLLQYLIRLLLLPSDRCGGSFLSLAKVITHYCDGRIEWG